MEGPTHGGRLIDQQWQFRDLPSFQECGSLAQMRNSRAIAAVPGDILVAGDVHGTVKVWRWKAPRMAVA